jgi:hypothetical protein
LPEEALHRRLVLTHGNHPPVVLAGHRVNIALAQVADVIRVFQLFE